MVEAIKYIIAKKKAQFFLINYLVFFVSKKSIKFYFARNTMKVARNNI